MTDVSAFTIRMSFCGTFAQTGSGQTVGLWIEVTGAGSVVVNGASSGGHVLMTAANSYSGLTTISAGTLALSGTGSIVTGGLNLGTTGSSGVFDLAGLTAGSYSLPATGNLTGVGTLSGSVKSLAALGSFLPGNISSRDSPRRPLAGVFCWRHGFRMTSRPTTMCSKVSART